MGASFSITYDVHGDEQVEHRLLGMGTRAIEGRPVLELIAEQMREAERDLFLTSGASAGEPWEPLKESTLRKKAAAGYPTAPNSVLIATSDLERSLTESGGDNIEWISDDELIFGTSDPKAGFHADGTENMPARPPLAFSELTLRTFTREIQRYIVGLEDGLGQDAPVWLR